MPKNNDRIKLIPYLHTHKHKHTQNTDCFYTIIILAGMLSQDELLIFTGPPGENVQLTRTAVRRIFEENITYKPMDMDYKVKIPCTASISVPQKTRKLLHDDIMIQLIKSKDIFIFYVFPIH